MNGFIVDDINKSCATVFEVSFKKVTDQTVLGVSKVRDVVGKNYCVSTRVSKCQFYPNLVDALKAVKEYSKKRVAEELNLQGEVDKLLKI